MDKRYEITVHTKIRYKNINQKQISYYTGRNGKDGRLRMK